MPPADRLQEALAPYARLAAPRAEGTIAVALHDSAHGPWTTIRWGRIRRDGRVPEPLLPPRSAHARLAEARAWAAIAEAETGGLARAMMAAIGLPRWILGGLSLEIRAALPPGAAAWETDACLLHGPPQPPAGAPGRIAALARLCAAVGERPWRDLHWWGDAERPFAFPAPPDGSDQAFWRSAWRDAWHALGGHPDDGTPAARLGPLLRRP